MQKEQNICCEKCGLKMGERTTDEIIPSLGTSVQIEKGVIFFQCSHCSAYKEIAKNTLDVHLYVPGFKRVF